MAKWILSCKELNGRILVSRLPKTIPPALPGGNPEPGIPSLWVDVGPGLRPSIQHYPQGGANDFLLMFDYLSHLVTRRIQDIDATWPPASVNPIGNVSPFQVTLAEDAIAAKLYSTSGGTHPVSTHFNPVILLAELLMYNAITDTYSVLIKSDPSFFPEKPAGVTPFYRVYRRPLAGGPWTMRMDWNAALNFTDTQLGGPFQFQYTATWGELFDPANPNDPNAHNEGTIGDGTIENFDSTVHPFDYTLTPTDEIMVGLTGTSSYVFADSRQAFVVEVAIDAISLTKARLEDSVLASPATMDDFVSYHVGIGDDSIILTKSNFEASSAAAAAGMFT
jgi:hypothetical protein